MARNTKQTSAKAASVPDSVSLEAFIFIFLYYIIFEKEIV